MQPRDSQQFSSYCAARGVVPLCHIFGVKTANDSAFQRENTSEESEEHVFKN